MPKLRETMRVDRRNYKDSSTNRRKITKIKKIKTRRNLRMMNKNNNKLKKTRTS